MLNLTGQLPPHPLPKPGGSGLSLNLPGFKSAQQIAAESAALFEAQPATMEQGSTHKTGKQVTHAGFDSQTIGTPVIAAHRLARVKVGASRTIDLGQFNSARLWVEVEVPCDIADVDSTYAGVLDSVNTKLYEALQHLGVKT